MNQLKWLWKNMEGNRALYVFALCSTVILSIVDLVNANVTAMIMDQVFEPIRAGAALDDLMWRRLIQLVVFLVVFTLFRTGYNYLAIISYEHCSQGLIYRLRRDLYANMQRQDMAFYSKNRTGSMMTCLT